MKSPAPMKQYEERRAWGGAALPCHELAFIIAIFCGKLFLWIYLMQTFGREETQSAELQMDYSGTLMLASGACHQETLSLLNSVTGERGCYVYLGSQGGWARGREICRGFLNAQKPRLLMRKGSSVCSLEMGELWRLLQPGCCPCAPALQCQSLHVSKKTSLCCIFFFF